MGKRPAFAYLSAIIFIALAIGCGSSDPAQLDAAPQDAPQNQDAVQQTLCGNGALDNGETCDTAIAAGEAGSCPQTCDDGNTCTADTLENAGTCSAACRSTPITKCTSGDGCCPSGCNAGNDSDCSASCGNGILDPNEQCDTAIADGAPGACPKDCNDEVACTEDALLNAGGCGATCWHRAITSCTNDDGCCPAACNASNDNDCSATCGNGVVEGKETCDTKIPAGDPGACPTSCDDGNSCTRDTLLGGGSCGAVCSSTPISVCGDQDGCCPTGCNSTNDGDCSASCGNGILEAKEKCDTGIAAGQPGACPQKCDDGNACTKDTLVGGGTCSAACTSSTISQCTSGDGCCPAGCNNTNDKDCSVSCGNGVLEAGEQCDTGIAAGAPGACPQRCDDGNACTTDTLLNGGTCSAQCSFAAITQCQSGDGCCPSGCNANTDKDCSATCGNGVLESGERCDTGIAAGQKGACPTSCNDGNSCTTDSLLNAGSCNAQCAFTPITQCRNNDGCCPTGCNANSDNDCSASCGNGVVEFPELCDTAIAAGQNGACPIRCSDGDSCTSDALLNGGTCAAQCTFTPITQCASGDGCCPAGCNANTDKDCSPTCGNGVLESGERCDTGIAAGQKGACPTACNDGDPCTTDTLLNGGTCSASCSFTQTTQCADNDKCCPSGCNLTTDNDCSNCPALTHLCNGQCVSNCSTATCGNRCTACPAPPKYATTYCASCSSCAIQCNAGRELCPLLKGECRLAVGTGKDGLFDTGQFPSSGANDANLPAGITRVERVFTVNTADAARKGTYNFTEVIVRSGDTLTAGGAAPLVLLVQKNATLQGNVALDGKAGVTSKALGAPGGAGGAGGGAGGAGGATCCQGKSGSGGGGGGGANTLTKDVKQCSCPAGCGGSFATAGGSTYPATANTGCRAGATYSWLDANGMIVGGSGGGGSGHAVCSATNAGSGGGGGGGGALRMVVGGRLYIVKGVTVSARGGAAGTNGGGGSGGAIELIAYGSLVNDGLIDARGAAGVVGVQPQCTTRLGGGDGVIAYAGTASGAGKTAPTWIPSPNVPKGCF